jgi:uracil-DNA glycosylase
MTALHAQYAGPGRTPYPERAIPTHRSCSSGRPPGRWEDETGRPFVGPAGGLLTEIIEKGMGLKRKDVFIANILKCSLLPIETLRITRWRHVSGFFMHR